VRCPSDSAARSIPFRSQTVTPSIITFSPFRFTHDSTPPQLQRHPFSLYVSAPRRGLFRRQSRPCFLPRCATVFVPPTQEDGFSSSKRGPFSQFSLSARFCFSPSTLTSLIFSPTTLSNAHLLSINSAHYFFIHFAFIQICLSHTLPHQSAFDPLTAVFRARANPLYISPLGTSPMVSPPRKASIFREASYRPLFVSSLPKCTPKILGARLLNSFRSRRLFVFYFTHSLRPLQWMLLSFP